MKREVRGITFSSFVWETIIFGGFISANELGIANLVSAYEWFFYFTVTLILLGLFLGNASPKFQYTKAKFHFEIITNTLLGLMLAYYGYFVLATIFTFFGYVSANKCYFIKENNNGETE